MLTHERPGGRLARPPQRETSLGDRFEPVPTTPKRLAEMLDCSNDRILGVRVGNETYKLSDRFYKSLASELGVPYGVFGLFTPNEVMNRAAERCPNLDLRVTMDTEKKEVLGITENSGVPMPVKYIENVLHNDPRTKNVEYGNGVISAKLEMEDSWTVPDDSDYQLQLQCSIPVDGIGDPSISLATLRQICTNGAVAEGKLFTTKMVLKDNSGAHFQRLLESFSNPDGVEAMEERLTEAASTKASVGEVLMLEGAIKRAVPDAKNQILLRERLYGVADNPCVRYGVTDLSAIGQKKRTLLPVGCSVADLMNFASELTTHHRDIIKDTKYVQAFYGSIMNKGCDLADLYPNAQKTLGFYMKDIQFSRAA